MANRGPRTRSPFSREEDIKAFNEEILRYDGYLIPLLVPVTLLPMVSAWAVKAAYAPAGAWHDGLVSTLATFAILVTLVGLLTMAMAGSLAVAAARANLGRRRVLQWVGLGVSAAVALSYQLFITEYAPSRQNGTSRIIAKGQALVDGIARFRAQYGRIPARLDELSPGFVDKTTVGMAGYRDFYYSRSASTELYTLSMPLHTWPQHQARIIYRSVPTDPAVNDPWSRYGEWQLEEDGPKR
jgi:hypothetical protein